MSFAELSEATKAWEASGRYVDVDGRRIFVYERGSGPVVLLLHGFPTSCYDWREVIDGLSGEYRCVAADFLGFGLSDKPEAFSYSLFQQADMVEGLAQAMGIEQAHVVSHDMGTSVHTELLARGLEGRPGFEVLSSTFLNGSMLMALATITTFQKLLASNETLPQAISICDNMTVNYVDGLKAIMKRPQCISDEDAQVMQELLVRDGGNRRLPSIAGYMRERYIHRDRWIGALKKAQAVQFVWADGDPIANVEMGRALRDEVPQARYTELKDIGHFLLMEDPATVSGRVREFLKAAGG